MNITMELRFTPEQEAQLTQMAQYAGKPVEQLLTDAAFATLREHKSFLETVEEGIAAADRGEFVESGEVWARVEKTLQT